MSEATKELAFGEALLEGLAEALAWKRGVGALEVVNVDPMPPARVLLRVIESEPDAVRRALGRG